MKVVRDSNPAQFLEQAGPLLYQDEPTNSLLLGLCETLTTLPELPKEAPLLLRVVENDRTLTAAIQTPPLNLVLTYATESALLALASELVQSGFHFPGVVGPSKESEIFANIWAKLTDRNSTLAMRQKIYKVEQVVIPKTEGEMRLAQPNDADLIAQWLEAFANESLPPQERKSLEPWKPLAVRRIEQRQVHLWTFKGDPVSMALAGLPTRNGVSVSGVYTPKGLRQNGYASSVVAHVSQRMLDSGKKFCVLYTDLSNPTSNKIYQTVGYKEVSDSKYFLLER